MKYAYVAVRIFFVTCFLLILIEVNVGWADEQLKKQLQQLKIITEEYPPISFTNENGALDGLAVEVVKEIMKRLQMNQKIEVFPWARAYKSAQKKPNYVLFSAGFIKEREPLFQWVGPIFTMESNFYVKKDSTIRIDDLNQAKKLKSIGTYFKCFDEQFLKKQGFTNLDSIRNNVLNMKKLIKDRIEAVTATNVTVASLLNKAGYSINDVRKEHTFLKTENYIIFSKNIPANVINAWHQALKEIKEEGLLQKIQEKWLS